MKWPEISEIEKTVPFPDGFTGQRLRRGDIPLLIKSIKKWYPDVVVGAASCYLVLTLYSSTAGMFKLPIFSRSTALGARSQACV